MMMMQKLKTINIMNDNQNVNGHNQSTWSTYVCKYSYTQPTPGDPQIQKSAVTTQSLPQTPARGNIIINTKTTTCIHMYDLSFT